MNACERLARAIAGQPVDVPAVAPAYLSLYLDAEIGRLYRQAYARKLAAHGGVAPVDHEEDARFRAEAILRAYDILGAQPDWIHTELTETREWAGRGEMRVEAGRPVYVDRITGERTAMDETGRLATPVWTRYARPSRTSSADLWDESAGLETRDDIDAAVPIPTAGELDAQGVFRVTEILSQEVGDRMPISCIAPTPFWSTYSLLGFRGMMVMMRDRPALFAYLMERRGRQRLERLAGLAAKGVRYLWLEECLSSADLISPRDYERFAFEAARPYIAEARRLGLTVILYYCGDVLPRLPWLRRLGMDALAVEESKKGFTVDIERVIDAVGGACCVFGNVDALRVMCEGTQATIEREVRRQLGLGRRARGFVLCQGSPFTLDTPPEKVGWFVESAQRFVAAV